MQFSLALRNARLDLIASQIGASAKLKIYTGSAPGAANAATGTLLSTLSLSSTWLNAASGGTKSQTGTWSDSSAAASGTPGYWRLQDSTGTTTYLEGTCGVGSGELNFLGSVSLGGQVTVTSFVLTEGNA